MLDPISSTLQFIYIFCILVGNHFSLVNWDLLFRQEKEPTSFQTIETDALLGLASWSGKQIYWHGIIWGPHRHLAVFLHYLLISKAWNLYFFLSSFLLLVSKLNISEVVVWGSPNQLIPIERFLDMWAFQKYSALCNQTLRNPKEFVKEDPPNSSLYRWRNWNSKVKWQACLSKWLKAL